MYLRLLPLALLRRLFLLLGAASKLCSQAGIAIAVVGSGGLANDGSVNEVWTRATLVNMNNSLSDKYAVEHAEQLFNRAFVAGFPNSSQLA